jgi:nucleotide-binding universal stress UspA family protein
LLGLSWVLFGFQYLYFKESTMYQTILVPLDGSKRAEAILPQVESLARQHNAKVIFLEVVKPQGLYVPPKPGQIEFDSLDERPRLKKVRRYLEVKQGFFQTKGLKAEIRAEEGPIVATIVNVADREQADLIVMTSQGRTGWSRLFHGSVAADVLDQADQSVLLIQSKDNEPASMSLSSSVRPRRAGFWQRWPAQDAFKEKGATGPLPQAHSASAQALMVWSDDGAPPALFSPLPENGQVVGR